VGVAENGATETRVTEIFRRALNREVASPQLDLLDTGLLDSLALVELLFELEREFAIELVLDDLEIESFRTVETIARVVDGQLDRLGSSR
jgi:acyl carrier protein